MSSLPALGSSPVPARGLPGSQFWSTRSATRDRAFRYWTDTICDELVELVISTSNRTSFEAWMLQRPLGAISLSFIHASQQTAVRTHEAICRTREPRFDLVHVRNGFVMFEHYGRNFGLRPGECVLLDSAAEYRFVSSEGSDCASLQIPQKWLRQWIPAPEKGIAQVFTKASPWGNALLATLGALNADTIEDLALPGVVVAEQVASLLALAIGKSPVPGRGKGKLLPRIRQTLMERAHDESLTPLSVAAEHGISKRYVHTLFASVGSTFSHELIAIRLERARVLLADARFANLTVSEIAWRCGFGDSSHFARRFHRAYGKSPTDYRRLHS